MKLPAKTYGWIFVLLAIALAACTSTSGTKIGPVFLEDEYDKGAIKSAMIIGIGEDVENTRLYEEIFADKLGKLGIRAASGRSLLPPEGDVKKEDVKAAARKNDLDTVLITRVVGVEEKTDYYRPVGKSAPPVAYYYRMDTYYPTVQREARSGVYIKRSFVTLETSLYATDTEQLIYTVQSDSMASDSVKKLIESVIQATIENMRENGLIE